jgi:hypothetical protein
MFNVGCSMFDVWKFEKHRTLNIEHPTSKIALYLRLDSRIHRRFTQNFPGLKGRHNPAQGNALGRASKNRQSPERAK